MKPVGRATVPASPNFHTSPGSSRGNEAQTLPPVICESPLPQSRLPLRKGVGVRWSVPLRQCPSGRTWDEVLFRLASGELIPARAVAQRLDKDSDWWQFSVMSEVKLERLREMIQSFGSCVVAYSGGVDSVFLARVAHDVLGERALAVIADSPSLPRREFDEAVAIAGEFGIPLRVVKTKEFSNPDYLSNPNNRCYFCKHELFTELSPLARQEGFAVIAYGENASDVGDFRPGAQAAAEFQVRAPLKEAGLTKSEIRELSATLGLPTAEKPQMACLSSRVPYGEAVTAKKLDMIERAENVLRDLGFRDVRVRHHELKAGDLARIEVGQTELPRIIEGRCFDKVGTALRQIGYIHVTLDLQGYRRGSLNEGLKGQSVGPGR